MFKLLAATIIVLAVSGAAVAAPSADYVVVDPDRVVTTPLGSAAAEGSSLIYLNACAGTGCDLMPGDENSSQNTSALIEGPQHMPPFSGGTMEWDAILQCVRDTFKPFDITITDQDPGVQPHTEVMVAGLASDVGMVGLLGGIAPYRCGETIHNAIAFAFADLVENDIEETCWVIAHEASHTFGLDHEYLCEDPMTYLRGCGTSKRFEDEDAPCGEYSERPCHCNGDTQNSFALLRDHFGAGIPTPPWLRIDSPSDGDQVEPGFIIRTRATDDIRIDRIDMRINSVFVSSSAAPPYIFNAPTTLSEGQLRVEVIAYDNYGYQTLQSIDVLHGQPCSEGTCAGAEACVSGRCVPGPQVQGGLGQVCFVDSECASLRCGESDDGNHCTEACDGPGTCPSGFGCLDTEAESVCWPDYDDSGAGCSHGSAPRGLLWPLLLAFALFRVRRRSRL